MTSQLTVEHVQVIENGYSVPRAMQIAQATCTERALYGCVSHWRVRHERCRPSEGAVVNILDNQGTPSSISFTSGCESEKSSKAADKQKKRDQQEKALKLFMPDWLDSDKTLNTMIKRPRRSGTEYARDMFAKKCDQHYHEN